MRGDDLWDGVGDAQAAVYTRQPQPGTLFNLAAVDTPDEVVWAGSPECARAIVEAGYPQTVALVPAAGRDLFAPLRSNSEAIGLFRKIILAGGISEHVEELARRLGRHRCWRVRWPDGCTDARGAMQKFGVQAVRDAIQAAEAYPIEGVHKPSAQAMLDFRHSPAPAVLSTGCYSTDQVLKFPGEGKLIVITGIPNHGKSTWVTHVMAHTAINHARKWAVFSPEMGQWQSLAAQVMAYRAKKPFRPFRDHPAMTDQEIAEGGAWCGSRFAFLCCESEDDAPTLEWLLERARACILRDGTTDLLIDPWNELDHDEGEKGETRYVGRCLQRLRIFANRYGCNVWIVAHPTKLRPAKPGESIPAPTIYDVNGSSNWANKADVMLAVHRPENVTQIHVLKLRFGRWGRKGAVVDLEFDPLISRFRSASASDAYHDARVGAF
jgi:twinkle protein